MTASIIRYFDYAAISQLLVKNLSSFKEQRQIVKFSRILRKKNYFSIFINFTDQRHVVDPVKNLWWSFFSKTADYFQPSTIFAKKRNRSHMPEFKIRLYDWPKVPENLWRFFIHCITYWVQKNFLWVVVSNLLHSLLDYEKEKKTTIILFLMVFN